MFGPRTVVVKFGMQALGSSRHTALIPGHFMEHEVHEYNFGVLEQRKGGPRGPPPSPPFNQRNCPFNFIRWIYVQFCLSQMPWALEQR